MYHSVHPYPRWQRTGALLAAALMILILVIPLVSAADTGLTRGSRFSVSVTGTPNTPYYVWLTRTYTMSGEPGDQPPVLLANQANIVKDPQGGPYVIGSYQFNNGGGRTILDDVAPSTASMSNTQYYGLVTTDSNGRATVVFQTSGNTAMRTFSVKVENPQSAARGNIAVQRGDTSVKSGAVGFDTVPPTPVPTPIPTTEPAPVLTTREISTPVPTTTPVPSPTGTPTPRVPLELGVSLVALAGAVLMVKRTIP